VPLPLTAPRKLITFARTSPFRVCDTGTDFSDSHCARSEPQDSFPLRPDRASQPKLRPAHHPVCRPRTHPPLFAFRQSRPIERTARIGPPWRGAAGGIHSPGTPGLMTPTSQRETDADIPHSTRTRPHLQDNDKRPSRKRRTSLPRHRWPLRLSAWRSRARRRPRRCPPHERGQRPRALQRHRPRKRELAKRTTPTDPVSSEEPDPSRVHTRGPLSLPASAHGSGTSSSCRRQRR